jgi:phenylalanyl-tRNA synthetase beta chain
VRVPLGWLRELVDLGDASPDDLAHTLTMGGLEVDEVRWPTAGVAGVVVAQVTDMAPVTGSDKLHHAVATDGAHSYEVVAGASNFAVGDKVPLARPGARLPTPDGPLTVSTRKIFGHTSNGMLASLAELGLGDGSAGAAGGAGHGAAGEAGGGIWVLDPTAPLGADLAGWLGLDEPVFVLEVTPDRGYALSLAGVARDLAALTGARLALPEAPAAPGADAGVPVDIGDASACPRFTVRRIEGLDPQASSPAWARARLAACGMRPISAVVDATNLAMLETGHPCHAYDLDRLSGPRLGVRRAEAGERVTTLDGVERACDPDDLLVVDDAGPVGFAGVMGGASTETHPGTTTVALETAAFDAPSVLRTARRHQLLTEASMRFEKTVPPATVAAGADRAAQLVAELGGGRVTGSHDAYPGPPPPVRIDLDTARARSVLGMDLDDARQRELLEAIGCAVQSDAASQGSGGNAGVPAAGGGSAGSAAGGTGQAAMAVTPPAYRPDLTIPADLHEELARLHGYDRIPERVPSAGHVGGRLPADAALRTARRALSAAGWTELLTLPFVAAEDVDALRLPDADRRRELIELVNPLSKEETALRTTMLPGMLKAVRRNVARQLTDVAVFEVGKVFLTPTADEPGAATGPGEDGFALPAEPLIGGLVACGRFRPDRVGEPGRDADVYDLLGAVDALRSALGRAPVDSRATDEAPYHPGRAARLSLAGVDVGVVGELHPRVIDALELPARTLAGELRLDRLCARGIQPPPLATPSPLPAVRVDVAVIVDEGVAAADVADAVRAGAGAHLAAAWLFDEFRGHQVGQGNKSLAYRLRLESAERQLTDDDAAAAIDGVERVVAQRLGGSLRR